MHSGEPQQHTTAVGIGSDDRRDNDNAEVGMEKEKEAGSASTRWADEGAVEAEVEAGDNDNGSSSENQTDGDESNLDDEPDLEEEIAEERWKKASKLKEEGNAAYRTKDIEEALSLYAEAIEHVPRINRLRKERSVLFANRAACSLLLEKYNETVDDCTMALRLQPDYLKALMRRCQAYEALEKLELAVKDAEKAVEIEIELELEMESSQPSRSRSRCSQSPAKASLSRLKPLLAAKQEKEKAEMLANLKKLGNTLLGKVGLSLDQFQAVQDPATGSYSISFNQK